jgi:hypothetical protein
LLGGGLQVWYINYGSRFLGSGFREPCPFDALAEHDEPGGGEMKAPLAIRALVILVAGCAAETMRGYVGQDIRAVEMAYGPPANQIDLGGGTRAFQWRTVSVSSTPATAVTTTDRDRRGRRITQTQFVGGTQTVTNCLYTFLTAWDPRRNSWIVTGFQQPSLDCAIGDLG